MKRKLLLLCALTASLSSLQADAIKVRVTPFGGFGIAGSLQHSGYLFTAMMHRSAIKQIISNLDQAIVKEGGVIPEKVDAALSRFDVEQDIDKYNEGHRDKPIVVESLNRTDNRQLIRTDNRQLIQARANTIEGLKVLAGQANRYGALSTKANKDEWVWSDGSFAADANEKAAPVHANGTNATKASASKYVFLKQEGDSGVTQLCLNSTTSGMQRGGYGMIGAMLNTQVFAFDHVGICLDAGLGIVYGSTDYKFTQQGLYTVDINSKLSRFMGMFGASVVGTFGAFNVELGLFAAGYRITQNVKFTPEADYAARITSYTSHVKLRALNETAEATIVASGAGTAAGTEDQRKNQNEQIAQEAMKRDLTRIIEMTDEEINPINNDKKKDNGQDITSKVRPALGLRFALGWQINQTISLNLSIVHLFDKTYDTEAINSETDTPAHMLINASTMRDNKDDMSKVNPGLHGPSLTFITLSCGCRVY